MIATSTSDLIAGALITEVISADGRWLASRFGWSPRVREWRIYALTPVFRDDELIPISEGTVYSDGPGMNALVALRRFLAEREREAVGRCDVCGRMLIRDDEIVMQSVTIGGETNAATVQAHRSCTEGEE